MACNCGKKNTSTIWEFKAPNGSVSNYTSQVQARSAQIRAGGGTITVKTS